MVKKKKIIKKVKPVKKQVKKEEVCNCCRQPSDKAKDSKVEKLKKLSHNNRGKKRVGFFGRLFGR